MQFSAPIPFQEALDYAESRGLLPTALSSAEIRAALDTRTLRQSVFSARTTSAGYLQTLRDTIADALQPQAAGGASTDFASLRQILQATLDDLGYTPELGFPGDAVPEALPGTLRDLSSQRRQDLILDTQTRQATAYGSDLKGNTPQRLEQYPAYELVRVRGVMQERGDWQDRFLAAGGTLYQGRMIAPKDSPVWQALGNIADDSLGNSYEPYAFNSGMGRVEVPRDEAIELGVIAPDELPAARDPQWEAELDDVASQFEPDLLAALKADLDNELLAYDTGDVLQEELAAARAAYSAR